MSENVVVYTSFRSFYIHLVIRRLHSIGANRGGALISFYGNSVIYSGWFSSDNVWLSASNKVSLQYMAWVGAGFSTIQTNNPYYSSNDYSMVTPAYSLNNAGSGYYRAVNDVEAYWPSNIMPSHLTGTQYSAWEQL